MKLLDTFSVWLGQVLAWGFLVIVAMMSYEVIARYAFNAPTVWAHEVAGVIAAVAFIFGGAYCMALDAHMRITSFVETRGERFAAFTRYLSIAAGTVYLAGLAYAAFRMTRDSLFRFGISGAWDPERSGSTWNTPAPSFIKLALFLGTVLFLVVLLRRLLRNDEEHA